MSALVAFCLAGATLAWVIAKPDTGTTGFACRASVVATDRAGRTLEVVAWGGSRSVAAYRGQKVSLRVGPRTEIAYGRSGGRLLTLRDLRPGAPISIAGTIVRTLTAPPSFTATRIIARKLVWSDEFNGPAGAAPDPSKWSIDTGNDFSDTQVAYYTTRSGNVALDGHGHLAITALRETYHGGGYTSHYTSGKLESWRFSTTYGSIQASIKVPPGLGLWPAFGGFGTDIDTAGWPRCGEIDVMECIGRRPATVFGALHGPSAADPNGYGLSISHQATMRLAQGFHVYGLNWSPGLVQMTLDGVPYATYTPRSLSNGQHWVFDKPFFLVLALSVGGDWDGAPDASTPFPATMLVDWVRVYAPG